VSARNPPALADWMLNRSGFARRNPPLRGDLLEEFRNGRSAAWYWRQTFLLVLTGLAQTARNSRRHLTGAILGWAAQAGVAFALWSLHFPPRMPNVRSVDVWVGLSWSMLWGTAFVLALILNKVVIRELKSRSSDPEGPLISACYHFVGSLVFYCMTTMIGVGRHESLLVIQGIILSNWIITDLTQSAMFARRKKP
jgi:hypothetical protein